MNDTTNSDSPSQEEFNLMQVELEEAIAGAFKLGLKLVKGDKNLSLIKIAIYLIIMERSLKDAFKGDKKRYEELIKVTNTILDN